MASMRSELESLLNNVNETYDRLETETVSVDWFGTLEPRTEYTKARLRETRVWLTSLLDIMVDNPGITSKPREH